VKRAAASTSSPQTRELPVPRALLSAGIELDPETEREREARLEALKEQLVQLATAGDITAVVDKALGLVVDLERENDRLAWRLLRAIRYRFGRQSEKLSPEELAQFCLALGGDEEAAAAAEPLVPAPADSLTEGDESDAADAHDETKPKEKRKRKSGGAIVVAPFVERVVHDVAVPKEERASLQPHGATRVAGSWGQGDGRDNGWRGQYFKPNGDRWTDVDIGLRSINIEVKSGDNLGGVVAQGRKQQALAASQGKAAVVYVPEASAAQMRTYQREGVEAYNDLDKLLDRVKSAEAASSQ
jgi:hypothetical protein